MTIALRTKTALVTLASIGLIGTLAGCSGAAQADGTSGGPGTVTTGTSTGSTTHGSYKDGSYNSNGSYVSPGGQETINVALTLKANVVTAITVKTVTADPTATQYEAMFVQGISKVVVGKTLDSLAVTKVSGSSLTSQGFDKALEAIKTAAAK
jgi:uncharacterized protein with FMN-binding domain